MEFWFYRLGKHLIAADAEAEQALSKFTQGEAFPVEIRRTRNLAHHRKWWSLLRFVFENQETYDTINHLHTAVKIAAGWYDGPVITEHGKAVYLPRSTSFASMDQTEFEVYYHEGIAAIVRLLPQWQAEDLLESVAEFA